MIIRAFVLLAALVAVPPLGWAGFSKSTPITPDGYGPVRIGMAKDEALKQLGSGWRYESVMAVAEGDDGECGYIDRADSPAVGYMVEEGVVTRVDVSGQGSAGIRTSEGIGIGALESDVLAAYGDKVLVEPRPYDGLPSKALTVWENGPPSSNPNARGIRFLTDGRQVDDIYAGTAAIEYWEGCN